MQGVVERRTRSGRAFGCWDAVRVAQPSQDFDLCALLQEGVAHHDRRNELLEFGSDSLDHGLENLSDDEIDCLAVQSALLQDPAPTTNTPPVSLAPKALVSSQLSGQARKKARKKVQSHKNRQKGRAAAKAEVFSHHKTRPSIVKKHLVADHATTSSVRIIDSKVARTAYVGLDDSIREGREYRLDELVGPESAYGFQLVKYRKGVSVPIVSNDPQKYIVAVFADTPDDAEWPDLVAAAAEHLEEARQACELDQKDTKHRRGEFSVLRCGVSHGGGKKMPGNVSNRDANADVARRLNLKPPFQRLAGFATAVMACWAPRMHDYYTDRLAQLHAKYSLQRNFDSSVFEATSYNLGPRTVSYRHLDFANLPFGWCAITALGNFDYTKGGHIVLWDARLVIEFPPGTTILLPSAIISHSNTAISTDERRYSFTQYTAGGLFRWVENGFQRSADLMVQLKKDPDALAHHLEEERGRWKFGLSLFARLDEIQPSSPS